MAKTEMTVRSMETRSEWKTTVKQAEREGISGRKERRNIKKLYNLDWDLEEKPRLTNKETYHKQLCIYLPVI